MIPHLQNPLVLFDRYLKEGYYPFALEDDFEIRILQVINLTLESDIPTYAGMNISTGRKLKQLLAVISDSVPFKPNMSKIAEKLNIGRNNIADYLLYMEEAGLINQLRGNTAGISGLGKVEKVYLENTNLIFSLAKENANIGNVRETFFLNQTKLNHTVHNSQIADFIIDDIIFEVGGKNKGLRQIRESGTGYVVKGDIVRGYLKTIPLWHFGLMY